ncbi:30S ribosome-binding factor RbfA [uncultured Gemmiger sp.]|uniref:30S ribosome-binding factor RbfA n=1 Tax=uncultured Gemmiger sp. TaxID=1623490 RepID=UPI0025FE373A|nr:30S ribosome-binding factor RbfA [uncultured Gemmiger sp.]
MPSKNQGRMAQDMKRELIDIIGHMKDPRITGGILTVTRLDVTPDLDVAKVHISVMGREGGETEVIKALNRAAGHVRTEISRRMHIRKAPRYVFVADDSAAYAAHINALLKQLDDAAPAGEASPEADAPSD